MYDRNLDYEIISRISSGPEISSVLDINSISELPCMDELKHSQSMVFRTGIFGFFSGAVGGIDFSSVLGSMGSLFGSSGPANLDVSAVTAGVADSFKPIDPKELIPDEIVDTSVEDFLKEHKWDDKDMAPTDWKEAKKDLSDFWKDKKDWSTADRGKFVRGLDEKVEGLDLADLFKENEAKEYLGLNADLKVAEGELKQETPLNIKSKEDFETKLKGALGDKEELSRTEAAEKLTGLFSKMNPEERKAFGESKKFKEFISKNELEYDQVTGKFSVKDGSDSTKKMNTQNILKTLMSVAAMVYMVKQNQAQAAPQVQQQQQAPMTVNAMEAKALDYRFRAEDLKAHRSGSNLALRAAYSGNGTAVNTTS